MDKTDTKEQLKEVCGMLIDIYRSDMSVAEKHIADILVRENVARWEKDGDDRVLKHV